MQMISPIVGALMLSVGLTAMPTCPRAADLTTYEIKPSDTDAAIRRFDEPNYVVLNLEVQPAPQLVVFLPGTRGKPGNSERFMRVVAEQGYRVIGLTYNDDPAVVELCSRNSMASCSERVRQKRIFGNDVTPLVDNTPPESIVSRLAALLGLLARTYPNQSWTDYLSDGQPNWSRIVVSGLSQGAGMAAYIAKKESVARVVLFSSPWDNQKSSRTLAPWIAEPSATPPARWFAEYHRRENTAALIAQAYRVLKIPPDHIRVFDLDLPPGAKTHGDNPFHPSVIRNPGYAGDWQFLFGLAAR